MSTMSTSEIRAILNKFLASAKKETGKNPSYSDLFDHVKTYCKQATIKKSSKSDKSDKSDKKSYRKNTTEPGGVFDGSLCYCRVWNNGIGKQCSNKIKEGDVCGTHMNSIKKFGGWSLGKYCDKQPTRHLFKHAAGEKGDPLPWKDTKNIRIRNSNSSKKQIDPYVMELKDKFEEEFGKRPRGPKASDIEWLRMKLNISSSDDESDNESDDDSESTFNNSFKNDCDSNSDSSEQKNDDDDEAEQKNDDDSFLDGIIKIKYEGITYCKSNKKDEDNDKYEISNEDDIIGYMNDDGLIEFEDGYDEIHQDHEDYNP